MWVNDSDSCNHINHEPSKPMSQSLLAKWRPCAKAISRKFCWASPRSFLLNYASHWCSTDARETWTWLQSQRRRPRPGSSGSESWFTRLKLWMRRRGWISILYITTLCFLEILFLPLLKEKVFKFFFFFKWLLPLALSQVGVGLVSESWQKQRWQDDI